MSASWPPLPAKGVQLRVLIEVDIGMGRCGTQPGEPHSPWRNRSSRPRCALRASWATRATRS